MAAFRRALGVFFCVMITPAYSGANMRLKSGSAMVLFAGLVATAQAQIAGPTPASNDRVGWIGFCMGFYSEIQREAIDANNTLLNAKAADNLKSYGDEELVIVMSTPAPPDAPSLQAWIDRGGKAAGKEAWDLAPMMDRPGQPSFRTNIIAFRSQYAQSCDLLATQSSVYHTQAETLRESINRSLATPPKGNAKH